MNDDDTDLDDENGLVLHDVEIQNLRGSATYLIDVTLDELASGQDPATTMLAASLPPRAFITSAAHRVRQAIVALIVVADRIDGPYPALDPRSLLEELVTHALIESADARLRDTLDHEPSEGWELFHERTFEDTDFLWLWDAAADGIDESDIGQRLGMASLSVQNWGHPFRTDRPTHPYFDR